jgi:hypothetical protein
VQPIISTPQTVQTDSSATGFDSSSDTDALLNARYQNILSINQRRPGFPEDIIITFGDTPLDTSRAQIGQPAQPAKFKITTAESGLQLDFSYRDVNGNQTIDLPDEVITAYAPVEEGSNVQQPLWQFVYAGDADGEGDSAAAESPPGAGDTYRLAVNVPFSPADAFTFTTVGAFVDDEAAREQFEQNEAYVVPNPYRGRSDFESERFASNEFERQIQFRRIPAGATIRIFTVRGTLVQTLTHDGLTEGSVAWDLRSKDNLEIAPGLYIFHVDAGDLGEHVGKFAIIK